MARSLRDVHSRQMVNGGVPDSAQKGVDAVKEAVMGGGEGSVGRVLNMRGSLVRRFTVRGGAWRGLSELFADCVGSDPEK